MALYSSAIQLLAGNWIYIYIYIYIEIDIYIDIYIYIYIYIDIDIYIVKIAYISLYLTSLLLLKVCESECSIVTLLLRSYFFALFVTCNVRGIELELEL